MNSDLRKPQPERPSQPSYAPPLMAVGLMCLLWGAVTTWVTSVIGAALIGIAAVRWIADK